MKGSIKVVRSPARMAWWVTYEDRMVSAHSTKYEAQEVANRLIAKYA